MHLLPSVAIHPNLELKTWPKQLLDSLPLGIGLPELFVAYPTIGPIEIGLHPYFSFYFKRWNFVVEGIIEISAFSQNSFPPLGSLMQCFFSDI